MKTCTWGIVGKKEALLQNREGPPRMGHDLQDRGADETAIEINGDVCRIQQAAQLSLIVVRVDESRLQHLKISQRLPIERRRTSPCVALDRQIRRR